MITLLPGERVLVEDEAVSMGLDTCCGTIIYDGRGNAGVSHASLPLEAAVSFVAYATENEGGMNRDLVTSASIQHLYDALLTNTDTQSGLRAIVCGCATGGIWGALGTANLRDALTTLERLRVPVSHVYAGTGYMTRVFLDKKEAHFNYFMNEKCVDSFSVPLLR